MTLQARVALAKRVPAGQGVSYGHRYTTDRETTLALVPLGYADGIPRHATNVGPVWVGGRRRRVARHGVHGPVRRRRRRRRGRGRRRGRSCSVPATAASPRPTTGRGLSAPSTTRSSRGSAAECRGATRGPDAPVTRDPPGRAARAALAVVGGRRRGRRGRRAPASSTGRTRPDPRPASRSGRCHGRGRTVLADDGVPLHVEVRSATRRRRPSRSCSSTGSRSRLDCWHYQRRDLPTSAGWCSTTSAATAGPAAPRGQNATIDQLGRDLYRCSSDVAPTGPVVLVGHSMGGMTIMALADQHPELFGDRVVGVGALATAPGAVGETVFGIPAVLGPDVAAVRPARSARSPPAGRPHRAGSPRRAPTSPSCSPAVSPRRRRAAVAGAVRGADGRRHAVRGDGRLLRHVPDHDKLAALGMLAGVQTLVLCGEQRPVTPAANSRDIADAAPRSPTSSWSRCRAHGHARTAPAGLPSPARPRSPRGRTCRGAAERVRPARRDPAGA